MPSMDGYQTSALIREKRGATPPCHDHRDDGSCDERRPREMPRRGDGRLPQQGRAEKEHPFYRCEKAHTYLKRIALTQPRDLADPLISRTCPFLPWRARRSWMIKIPIARMRRSQCPVPVNYPTPACARTRLAFSAARSSFGELLTGKQLIETSVTNDAASGNIQVENNADITQVVNNWRRMGAERARQGRAQLYRCRALRFSRRARSRAD
jgi:hypothetical protein